MKDFREFRYVQVIGKNTGCKIGCFYKKTKVLNKIWQGGAFSEGWRVGVVKPIYKKGCKKLEKELQAGNADGHCVQDLREKPTK